VTRLLTYRGLLSRDFESFGARFRGLEGDFRGPIGPQSISPKNSIEAGDSGFGVNLLGKATKPKTPSSVGARRSALTCGRSFVREKVKGSPKQNRNGDAAVSGERHSVGALPIPGLQFSEHSNMLLGILAVNLDLPLCVRTQLKFTQAGKRNVRNLHRSRPPEHRTAVCQADTLKQT